ncbi:hypothetical protein BDA99DRAFT_559763 [Phascolomyces articulosus]|uniref:NmrA-like domain-containing protein n=1 Tax=Phascolomyces articulosus TaxID=60185 RepID=A0AAD5K050_9FUNG|nr:hypothetical protein BDA99DRAFT_559763 [Phascolomyces articulosus]
MPEQQQQKIFAMTNADSLLGYAQAYYFLKQLEEEIKKNIKLRLFCRQKDHYDMQTLEKMGGELIETDYMDPHQVDQGLEGVYYLMYIPEFANERFQQGYNVLTTARKHQVQYVSMLSILGVDHAIHYNDWPNLNTYYRLEQIMCNNFNSEQYCIFRLPMFNTVFYTLTPMVENENKLRMPLKKGTRIAIIDMEDCIEGIYNLSVEKEDENEKKDQPPLPQEDNQFFFMRYLFPSSSTTSTVSTRQQQESGKKKKNRTMFEFTPANTCPSGEEMAQQMAQGLDKEHLDYDEISEDEMRQYLESIRHDERFHRGERKNEYLFPVGSFVRDNTIHTLMEYYRLTNSEQDPLDKVTQDLEHALHRSPMTLLDFFRKNRENFRPLQ